ncbi:LOW QUALITY PROTEIN: vomeronasal type-1 receptor 1-like [Trichechus inunguis]
MGSASMENGILFLIQTGVGILGNSSLLCLYNFTLITGHILRPSDLILNQVVLANSLVLFSKGIPQTMAASGLNFFLDDAGCKFVCYLHRVGRGVSLSTTCILSGFQAIKLCLNFSRWVEVRIRSPTFIGSCCFLCWILHLLLNILVPLTVNGPQNSTNTGVNSNFGYCSVLILGKLINKLHAIMFSFIEVIQIGLVVWASGSMVLVLHRHKKQVEHIHSSSLSPRPYHGVRATHTILILVSMFVSFYSLPSILIACISLTVNPGQWLVDTSVLVASGFPAFSPFVLMTSDARVSRFFFACLLCNKIVFV